MVSFCILNLYKTDLKITNRFYIDVKRNSQDAAFVDELSMLIVISLIKKQA